MDKNADELFMTYMQLVSRQESEEVYRMLAPIGEGIMKHTHIAEGVELVYSELESYSPCFQSERKEVDVLEIMYILEGRAEFDLQNHQLVTGEKGDVMMFNSQTPVKKSTLDKDGLVCLSMVCFPKDTVKFLNDFLSTSDFSTDDFFTDLRKGNSVITFPAGEILDNLFLQMVHRSSKYSKHFVKLAYVQALILLMHCQKHREATDFYFNGSTGRKVQQVRRLLSTKFEEDVSIEQLSELVKLNRTTLQKVFKEMYGLTINDYRMQVKIQQAKNLLISTKLSITEIAGRCGYINSSKFSSAFKRVTNMLPKDWRKNNLS
ncbi:MAG: AraC family transcriptional regulator [Treponema sp.]|nr:AraC family transcriptional regulator [Treponema sp.]